MKVHFVTNQVIRGQFLKNQDESNIVQNYSDKPKLQFDNKSDNIIDHMKISSKQIMHKKEQLGSKLLQPTTAPKGMSRSLSRVKMQTNSVMAHSPTKKKGKELQIIKEKNDTPKKKGVKENQEKSQPNKKKKTNYCLNLKELKPVNLQKQKELFFKNQCKYDPFFIYPNISDLNDDEYKDMRKYEKADERYLSLAIAILQKSKQIGIAKMFAESPLLNKQETEYCFNQYIARLNINDLLTYEFVENTIAPTSVVHNNQDMISRVMISVPILYRRTTIEGVLNHEIGTHFLRKYNDRQQKWNKDRKKYSLGPYLQTEEGFAALNQLCSYVMQDTIPPFLYRPAMMYYLCVMASRMSFSQLYQQAARYQPDPEHRWRECVRVKRGIADTSKAAGMHKDQIYFMGALQILKLRKQINFYHLFSGKISLEDCLRMSSKGHINEEKLKFPHFIGNMKYYLRCLDFIAKTNNID